MSTISPSDNPQPKVGQLLYNERVDTGGNFQSASLVFVDEEVGTNQQWMYTEIALMEDFGEGMEVYAGIESGGMPPRYTRIATDEDIVKFLKLIKEGKVNPEVPDIASWLKDLADLSELLEEEKERLERLASTI